MKRIAIFTEDIVKNTPYMKDTLNRLDLLGQIYVSGFKIQVPQKTRTPQELDSVLYPFTEPHRNKVCNTCLTLTLLQNAERMSGLQQLEAANKLLKKYEIVLEKV